MLPVSALLPGPPMGSEPYFGPEGDDKMFVSLPGRRRGVLGGVGGRGRHVRIVAKVLSAGRQPVPPRLLILEGHICTPASPTVTCSVACL